MEKKVIIKYSTLCTGFLENTTNKALNIAWAESCAKRALFAHAHVSTIFQQIKNI